MLYNLDRYDVVWDSPGKGSSDSLPVGNGDIGLNVWVEENRDLMIYLGKTDSWDENGRLLKLGLIRVAFTPNPFSGASSFCQTLHLRDGTIGIQAGKVNNRVT